VMCGSRGSPFLFEVLTSMEVGAKFCSGGVHYVISANHAGGTLYPNGNSTKQVLCDRLQPS
jgi:hypothetical protein